MIRMEWSVKHQTNLLGFITVWIILILFKENIGLILFFLFMVGIIVLMGWD